MADDKPTLIDGQADVEGRLKGKDAHILGRFKGEVEVSGRLFLGEGARVDAKVVADAAEKAKVEGSVDAQVLVVKEGAQLNGAVTAGGAKGKAAPATSPAVP